MLADRNPQTARRGHAVAAGAALGAFMLAAIASAAFGAAAAGAHSAVSTPPGLRPVSYGGYTFQVPGRWAVIDLAHHRRQCPEFNRHVVYLGVPGPDPACPSALIGTTEALLVQPTAPRAVVRAVENPVDRLITVVTGRITVTATYGAHREQIEAILASASLPVPTQSGTAQSGAGQSGAGQFGTVQSGTVQPNTAQSVPTPIPASATNYTGQGFDTCAAPSASVMQAVLQNSPYRAVGVYIGGSDRACGQVNLSAAWVSGEAAAGWHFLPLYVGPQASFGELTSPASQAASGAEDAVNEARLLGFGPQTTIYYDMEAYPGGQTPAVLTFFSSWTRELHALGYRSGIYSSSLSGVSDLVNNYTNPADTMPDVIYDALWNGDASTQDPVIPVTSWPGHLRVHQYSGSVTQIFGGVSLDLDQDYLDVQQAGAGGSAQASQAVADQSSGVVNTFFRGSDGALWHDWFAPGTGWHGPTSFGGSLAAAPTVVASTPQSVAVFYKGTEGNLWYAAYTPGIGWSARRDLGMGTLGSRPVAVAQADGVMDVFWQGSVGSNLWHARFTPGGGWAGPQNLGGALASDPSPAVSGGGTVSVFWRGTDGQLWQTLQSPGLSWRRPASLGVGKLGGGPDATGEVNGTIDVFWNGTVKARASLWHATYTAGSGWGSQSLLAAGVASEPFAVAPTAGAADVFWMGSDGGLWWAARAGGTWQNAVPLATGKLASGPFAAAQGSGVIDVFWRGLADSGLWQARYSGSWAGPVDLGGSVG
jgi:Domain of unknown function (DUF1906)